MTRDIIRDPIITDDCDIVVRETVVVNGQVQSDREYEDPRQPYAGRCGGEREAELRALYETKAEERRRNIAYEILAKRAGVVLQSPFDESKVTQRMLAVVDSEFPEIAEEGRKLLAKHKISEQALRERVAVDDIHGRFGDLRSVGGDFDIPAVAAILGLYYQDSFPENKRRYPKLEQAFLREVIDGELEKAGLRVQDLEAAYTQAMFRNTKCRNVERADGVIELQCGVE
ncbi:MAG: hypothetical protein H6861_07385 [Rhodospirillales bacterium]|nr:hypothetical protein [Rhodospirillales bacterium]